MSKTPKKTQLIYVCASEAVARARIEINTMTDLSKEHRAKIDRVLSLAQHNAGRWAVDAYDADARTTTKEQICR